MTMTRPDALTAAGALVGDRFPNAEQAWLGGSVVMEAIRRHCERVLAAGPGLLTQDAVDSARYALSDLIDDLRGGATGPVGTAIAIETWRHTANLILGVHGCWSGGGKWLMRELLRLDESNGSTWTATLDDALRSALDGDPQLLQVVADRALSLVGGRLWEGYTQAGRSG